MLLSWLLVVGSSITVIPGALSTVTRFIHDTLVFAMSSRWLYRSNSSDRHDLKTVVFGRHLFPLTRSLLHNGHWASVLPVRIFSSDLDKPFAILGSPLSILINNMASHVYRNLVSAKYWDHYELLQWVDEEWREDISETPVRRGAICYLPDSYAYVFVGIW